MYPAYLASLAHPDQLAVRAHLRGLTSPPPDRCRVLELGCGAGWSLLAFGHALPGSEFFGVDLSGPAIAQGQAWASGLGLTNVHLAARDAMEIGEADGQFDYIFAHGFLSWVPEPVRRKTFEIVRDRLAPSGVAYVSYNAYPGGHLREMVSGMMRFHTRNLAADSDRLQQALGLLGALLEPPVPETSFHDHLARFGERIGAMPPEQLLFDELADENRHFYFHEFVTIAGGYGLEFLAEAELADLGRSLPPKTQALLARMPDRLTREQYLDFFLGRAFRQTLICHAGLQRPSGIDTDVVSDLWIGGPMESEGGERWTGAGGSAISTSHATTQAAFERMGSVWPGPLQGKELLAAAPSASDAGILANILRQCIESGVLRAHLTPPPAGKVAGDRPCASALARAQIGQRFVPSLACEPIELSSDADERLLALLDGSLTRPELTERLAMSPEELDASLRRFVRLELIQ